MKLIIAVIAVLIAYCQCTCPETLRELSPGLCIKLFLPGGYGFCEANDLCVRTGKDLQLHLILIGRNYTKLAELLTPIAESMWTTLNDIFSITNGLPFNWRDGDPRDPNFLSTSYEFLWNINEPRRQFPFAYYTGRPRSGLVSTGHQSDVSIHVPCELLGPIPFGRRTVKLRDNTPTIALGHEFGREACVEAFQTPNLISCNFRCARKLECRASHYNQQLSTCILSLHIVSPVPETYRDRGGQWHRFGKTGLDTVLTD